MFYEKVKSVKILSYRDKLCEKDFCIFCGGNPDKSVFIYNPKPIHAVHSACSECVPSKKVGENVDLRSNA